MQIPITVDRDDVNIAMSMYFDHQWDGDKFHGKYHGIVHQTNGDSPTPIYVTHIVADSVQDLVKQAEVYAKNFLAGDFYPLLDPAAADYMQKSDTIL